MKIVIGKTYWAVKKFYNVDPNGRGHWYECREVIAPTRQEAIQKAFGRPTAPRGWRVELK